MSFASRFIVSGILFVITVVSGMWLNKIGRPLNPYLFTVHKIAALVIIILVSLALYSIRQYFGDDSIVLVSAVCAALSLLILLISGIYLSFEIVHPGFIIIIHRIAPWTALISALILIMRYR